MAIEVLSGISSPRISFSNDLDQNDDVGSIEECRHWRLDTTLLNSSSDFDFCFEKYSFVQELPSADELFSNGKILPIEIKRKPAVPKQAHRRPEPVSVCVDSPRRRTITTESSGTKIRLKEFLSMSIDADDKPASKSFWQFKRSSSLNCESSRSKSLIRSLQFLTRSNSTGSTPIPKETQKHTLLKQPSLSRKSSVSSSSSSGTYYSYGNPTQKPSCGAHGTTGVRVSPVLNLPHPIISNVTVGFFGFGSLFCNGKVKKKKR
ncbi:hypothetical protein F3Y22_tig00112928pilonHSYRG00022 [Hibiscus syriacus]|uniref:Uncharacterized protein n=1 Tax=Hibiscus syriacus TaxID=106335 RepID=A0A6A2WSP3_HIBSY|nr:uncharacterized protein LOC120184752 [Hibiscus syriacus]KAE8663561.1 hypothetical protein F3Y22_tig00112928pilonHSYRG00022 [Hibiscus syriacus]